MAFKQISFATAFVLALAAAGCAPVFHAGDYAGLTPVAPIGSTATVQAGQQPDGTVIVSRH